MNKINQINKTGLIYDHIMMKHHCRTDDKQDIQNNHPEQPNRIVSIYNKLKENKLTDLCVHVPIRQATEQEILTTHTQEHLNIMRKTQNMSNKLLNTLEQNYNSIYLNNDSYVSALYSCGGVIQMCEDVRTNIYNNGVAIVRPPGHHAESECAMGFCIFNNVAVAANVLKQNYNVKKTVILDWDVHHGNATQHSFYDDPSVLYISLHRYDYGNFYPAKKDAHCTYVGAGKGSGYNINIAFNLKKNTIIDDNDYKLAFETIIIPVLQEYKPEIIIVSAGFDCAEGDPLGGLHLSPNIFYYMTRSLMAISKVVVALEGGYNLDAISNSMTACVKALTDKVTDNIGLVSAKSNNSKYDPDTINSINDTLIAIKPYWSCLKDKKLNS